MELNRNVSMSSAEDDGAPKGSSDRTFGFVFAVFFALVAVAPLRRGGAIRWWALIAAAAFAVVAITCPGILALPNRLWTKLGDLLHRLTSPIALGLIYWVGIVPIGIVMRLTGKDALRLRWQPNEASYWIVRHPPGRADAQMKNQF